ncbi:MAG: hypothetical protein ACSLE1_15790 [Sphingobium sp.]
MIDFFSPLFVSLGHFLASDILRKTHQFDAQDFKWQASSEP